MNDAALNDRLFLSFSVALGIIVAGVGNALFGPRAGWARAAIAGTGLLATLAAVHSLIPGSFRSVAALGGSLWLLTLFARVGAVRRVAAGLAEQVRKPRVAWAFVALGGVGLMASELIRFDAAAEAGDDEDERWRSGAIHSNPYVPAESRPARTDRGSAIPLMTVADAAGADRLASLEHRVISASQMSESVIRRGPPDDGSNCHGWIFAGGKYAILGHDVETILAENRYTIVAVPRLDDLCLYRSDAHAVSHTALVRCVLDDGTVLVEGKWGRLGVFLHPADHSAYGTHFTFHRTDRGTHVLGDMP